MPPTDNQDPNPMGAPEPPAPVDPVAGAGGVPPETQPSTIPGEPLLNVTDGPAVPPIPQPGDPPVGGDAPGDTPLPPVQPPVGDDGVPPVPQPGDAPSDDQGPTGSAL